MSAVAAARALTELDDFARHPVPGTDVVLVDEATGAPPIGGGPPPQRLRIEYRPRSAADYGYIVKPLRVLCQAAVATGNPVHGT